jgi:hypothetical protein
MKLIQEQPSAAPQTPVVALPLPDGTQARLTVEEDEGGESGEDDPEHASLTISYASPALGIVGLNLSLAPGSVAVRAELAAGEAFELASEASDELRARLADATGRAAQVTVVPRREPLDLYA